MQGGFAASGLVWGPTNLAVRNFDFGGREMGIVHSPGLGGIGLGVSYFRYSSSQRRVCGGGSRAHVVVYLLPCRRRPVAGREWRVLRWRLPVPSLLAFIESELRGGMRCTTRSSR